MIKGIKKEHGITLITLVITVTLLIIITGTLAKNAYSSVQLSNLTKLQNDIEILSDRIAAYYVKNGKLPIHQLINVDVSTIKTYTTDDKMTKAEVRTLVNDLGPYDNDTYYVIDIEELENATLNYGMDYGSSKPTTDKYIVNEESHEIYYLKGIRYNGQEYHTIGTK